MRIKIVDSSDQAYWYSNRIGQRLEVEKSIIFGGYVYYFDKPERGVGIIEFCDAIIVNEVGEVRKVFIPYYESAHIEAQ